MNYNTEMTMLRMQGPNTLSAMTDKEPQLSQVNEEFRDEAALSKLEQHQPVNRRQTSYSTTNSLKPMNASTTRQSFNKIVTHGKPTRPISSGVYMRNRRNQENNITPSLGVLHED